MNRHSIQRLKVIPQYKPCRFCIHKKLRQVPIKDIWGRKTTIGEIYCELDGEQIRWWWSCEMFQRQK